MTWWGVLLAIVAVLAIGVLLDQIMQRRDRAHDEREAAFRRSRERWREEQERARRWK